MSINIFQFVILIIGFIFFLISVDFFKARKFTFAHVLVLGGGSVIIAGSFLYPGLLDRVSHMIGLARGADMIVYFGLILLLWIFLGLYNRQIKSDIVLTDLVRSITIEQARGSISDTIDTVIVMPTYRQTKAIIPLVRDILQLGHGVIRVDDGENGDLYQHIATSFKTDDLVILRHSRNMGVGAATQTGNKYALEYTKAQYIMQMDSDGQHQVKDIQKFIDAAQDDTVDVVMGSRFLEGAQEIPFRRKVNKKLHLLFTKIFIGIQTTDTHNGFRLIKRRVMSVLTITMNSYEFCSEIESKIHTNKLEYIEVPVDVIYGINEHGQSLRNALNVAKKIIYRNVFFK